MRRTGNGRRARWWSGAGLVSSVLWVAVAAAQAGGAAQAGAAAPSGSSASVEQAQSADTLIEDAVRRRRSGDDAGARAVLERARQLEPGSTRVLVHLASVEQALGNWVAAKALLVEVLRRPGDGYVERNRGMLRDALEAVAARLGRLLLLGGPSGARVRLDGNAVGTLPLPGSLELATGRHVLEVDAVGYFPLARSVEILSRGQHDEALELMPLPEPGGAARARDERSGRTRVLTWSLAGAGALAAIGGGVAWGLRESHASTWNSDACLPFGSTRERRCGSERDAAQRYQALAITGGVAAVLLGSGAALSAWLVEEPAASTSAGLRGCGVAQLGLWCHGHF